MNQIDNTVCLLNIGLARADLPGGRQLFNTPEQVFSVLEAYGFRANTIAQYVSGTEPTIVIHGVVPSANAVYAVASLLNQDCIAVFDVEHQTGHLIGPAAEKWGAFDPAQFILLDGSLLSEHGEED